MNVQFKKKSKPVLLTQTLTLAQIFCARGIRFLSTPITCVFVCFPGVTTHCGCTFTAQ